MSGGSFSYAYRRVEQFCEELERRVKQRDFVDEWEPQPNYVGPEAMIKLREILVLTCRAAKLMREVEWLYSGDTSDESFLERVNEIEAE